MALIVENGAGLENAESYVTVVEFEAYAERVGFYVPEDSGSLIEQALRRATIWIDARYGATFKGTWATSSQALEWPRSGAIWRNRSIDKSEIPAKLKNALCEAAWREFQTSGSLSPDIPMDRVKRDKLGDAETEYELGPVESSPTFKVIDDLMSELLENEAQAYVGKAVRA